MMRRILILVTALVLTAGAVQAQRRPLPQGSGVPGLPGIGASMDGPGYLEFGYGHSGLTDPNPNWNDLYLRGMVSGGSNEFDAEVTHQTRYGDSGWYTALGWRRLINQDWYADLHVGTSFGGVFLPKLRTDAFVHRKLLAQRQFVASAGFGYDRGKPVNEGIPDAIRGHLQGTYYLQRFPIITQAGVSVTRSQPGSVLAKSGHAAVTYGHEKERFVTLRYEVGREAYEVFSDKNALFNFPIHNLQLTWREWIGFNWGVNVVIERDSNPIFRRTGGTVGFFLDF